MKFRNYYFFIILIFMTLFSGIAVYNLSRRPALPFPISSSEQGLSISLDTTRAGLKNLHNTKITAVDRQTVKTLPEIDEIIDRHKIGQMVSIQFSDGDTHDVILIPRNTIGYLLLNSLLALSFLVIAGIVWKLSTREYDKFFAVTAQLFGYILAMGWPGTQLASWIAIPLILIYFICYPQAFLSFLYFCYQFPSPSLSQSTLKKRQWMLISIGFFISIILMFLFLRKYYVPSQENIEHYHSFYRIFRVFILLSLLYSLSLLIKNLKQNPNPVNRNKVLWVFGGILWGSFPFIFLWNLPQIFGFNPLIPEWIYVIFLLLIPISVSIAILRYRLFDIEIVLSRSLVYSVVFIALIIAYLSIIGFISLILHDQFSLFRYPFLSTVSAAGLALLVNPLRTRIQAVVDKKFFRIRFDRFQMLREFMNDLKNFTSRNEILEHLSKTFTRYNPLQDELFFIEKDSKWYPVVKNHSAITATQQWLEKMPADSSVFTQENSPYLEEALPYSRQKLPDPWIISVTIGKYAIWNLGKKRAETRFWKEDIDLILQLVQAARLQLEKIEYIELSLFESIQKEQALKQSEWQKLLFSEVAHDIRSPLNTILWRLKNFQNDLEQGGDPDQETMEGIKSQIFLLQKHIESLLILSQYEHGRRNIPVHPVPIHSEIEKCLLHLEELLNLKEISIECNCDQKHVVLADEIILQLIFLNLLQNAIKFSPSRAILKISTVRDHSNLSGKISVIIEDEAGGIPRPVLDNIFEPFNHRKKDNDSNKSFHLGLYIVNEFTQILNGDIHIDSSEGKGTTVLLTFPAAG